MGKHLYKQGLRRCYGCKEILPLNDDTFCKYTSTKFKYICKSCNKIERKQRNLKLRFIIFQRDNFTCQYCGRKAPNVELQLNHIYPKSRGGLNKKENYKTACKECNIGKSDMILTEFL